MGGYHPFSALERVFGDENQTESYLSYIEEKSKSLALNVAAKYTGLDETGKQENVKLAIARFTDELTNDGEFGNMQNEVDDFIGHCRYSVRNWVPWTITSYISRLDNNLPEWEDKVTRMSTNHEWTVNEPYRISSVASEKLIEKIIHPEDGIFSSLAIIVMIVLQGVILLSYLAGRNWANKGPIKPKGDVAYTTWVNKN